MYNFIVDPIL